MSLSSYQVDITLHLRFCINHFQHILTKSNHQQTGIELLDAQQKHPNPHREVIRQVYQNASQLLGKLLQGDSWLLGPARHAACTQHASAYGASASAIAAPADVTTNSTLHQHVQQHVQYIAALLVEDLILITSFACGAAWNNIRDSRTGKVRLRIGNGDFLTRNKEPILPTDVLISLSPFWAIINALDSLITLKQPYTFPTSNTSTPAVDQQLLLNISYLVSKELIYNSLISMNEDILRHMTYSQTLHIEHSYSYSLYTRLKKALKIQLKTPLFFSSTLAMALHTDLLIMPTSHPNQDVLTSIDILLICVNHIVIKAHPTSALTQEACNGHTIMSLVAAYHDPIIAPSNESISSDQEDSDDNISVSTESDSNFSLSLAMIICHYAISTLTLSDRHSLYPIHHAARKGHSSVLEFILTQCKHAILLQDDTSKYPLHHAVLSAAHHHNNVILHLASLSPAVLVDCNAFNILAYASNYCDLELYKGLQEIAYAFQGSNSNIDDTFLDLIASTSDSSTNTRKRKLVEDKGDKGMDLLGSMGFTANPPYQMLSTKAGSSTMPSFPAASASTALAAGGASPTPATASKSKTPKKAKVLGKPNSIMMLLSAAKASYHPFSSDNTDH